MRIVTTTLSTALLAYFPEYWLVLAAVMGPPGGLWLSVIVNARKRSYMPIESQVWLLRFLASIVDISTALWCINFTLALGLVVGVIFTTLYWKKNFRNG